jgi:16S rRNA (cytosine967-C5)-methyltransferase
VAASRAVTARRVAFHVVRRVFEEDAWADRAFRAAADAAALGERDRAFAMQLGYGTVQRARTLDHAIEALGRRPVRKLDPPVRAALRLGAYQLAHADSVPLHAAVDETVELVRRAGLERAVAFTNAVMRRLSVGLRDLLATLPERTADEAALRHSYPDWVARVWWRDLGREDALALMRAQNEPAETCVRVNRPRAGADALPGRRDPDLPDALVVDRVEPDWLERGLVWPQSRGSQLAGLAVGSRPGERILDLCAAPGGKATQLEGEVTAVERHEGRARALEETVARLGASGVRVVVADGLDLPSGLAGFDRALVDAPCSGLGTLRRNPDLRWRLREGDPAHLAETQRALLRRAAAALRPGGALVYSTCTLLTEENEAVVDAFLAETPAFRRAPADAVPASVRPLIEADGALRTWPHRHDADGFYAARLERTA